MHVDAYINVLYKIIIILALYKLANFVLRVV